MQKPIAAAASANRERMASRRRHDPVQLRMQSLVDWRRQWRFRGLAVDRLFPKLYVPPVPAKCDLEALVALNMSLHGNGRYKLTPEEDSLTTDCASDMAGYIAENLPMQVVATAQKSFLPTAASGLAVRSVAGETEYI